MDDYLKSRYTGVSSPFNDSSETSALGRMQQQYWTTKHAVFKKLGKKEDDCIISSDLELDLKLELYQAIEESFLTLMRVLEVYQEKLCVLAQEENALGRFLKENGKKDKTRAGKAMTSAGKALSYSAQQRLTLRIPLVRLYQEVETFQYRAIVDTLQTVEKMEKARTAYRGSLMWMKDVSQQLDPDTCKQMDKFRKVQSQVRKTKQRFDKMKLDTLQKVDLLSFSRCNLFSQALASYQSALLNVSKKIAQSSDSVAVTTKGYQHYEFSLLKELTETSKKLAEDTSESKLLPDDDKDTLLYFESEYYDDISGKNSNQPTQQNKSTQNTNNTKPQSFDQNSPSLKAAKEKSLKSQNDKAGCVDLLNLSENNVQHSKNKDEAPDELLSLDDGMQSPLTVNSCTVDESLLSEWEAVFGSPSRSTIKEPTPTESAKNVQNSVPCFLPSQLLSAHSDMKIIDTNAEALSEDFSNHKSVISDHGIKESDSSRCKAKAKQDKSAWFSLFADLDPLANPDLIGNKKGNYDDRNC